MKKNHFKTLLIGLIITIILFGSIINEQLRINSDPPGIGSRINLIYCA